MTGILAINAFLHSEKYTQQDKLLLAGAKACGINLKIYSNLELRLAVPKADFVLFWDKDVSLAHALEQQGLPVFNSAKAIALCDNKALTYQPCPSRRPWWHPKLILRTAIFLRLLTSP